MPDLKDIILGNIAVERGMVSREALLELQKQQRDSSLPLGQVMLRAGLVNGPKLIELMKLVSLTIEHLDGGLEVGADQAESGSPAMLVGMANEPSKAPQSRDDIPVAPVVGGMPARTAPQRPPATATSPAAASIPGGPRAGIPTPRPMPAPGLGNDGPSPRKPTAIPSPIEQTPRPVPPPEKPRTDRFEPQKPPARPAAASRVTPAGNRPKTEAFKYDAVETFEEKANPPAKAGPPSRGGAPAPAAYKPKTEAPIRPPTRNVPPQRPNSERFDAARAGGKTPSEAFRMELVAREKKSEVPEVQGSFGQAVIGETGVRKDKTRLFSPVSLPQETPAGRLPPEVPGGTGEDNRISVPPGARERLAGMTEGAATPAGRLPAGIDAESKAIVSPLDDLGVKKGDELPFEMPPGADREIPAPQKPPSSRGASRPPVVGRTPGGSRPPMAGAPGSSRLPTAQPEGGRMNRPEDSGFEAQSNLPDFEIRASDKPGGKPVVVKNPKPPDPPKKETRRIEGKGPARPGQKVGSASGLGARSAAARDAAKKDEKEAAEEPKKRSKKLLVTLLVILALILAGGGALFYLKKITIAEFKKLPQTIKEIPDLIKHGEYWKDIFKF